MDILNNIDEKWKKILKRGLKNIYSQLGDIKDVCPPQKKWFEFARLTPFDKIKIVIIGQDPYYTKDVAHGLAFSSTKNVPPSLKNIFKCLHNYKLIKNIPKIGNLTKWAKQGVLLLNMALTTIIGKPGIHNDIWSKYVINIIKEICKKDKLVFMLWGNHARKIKKYISNHIVLEWSHPSPMAQTRLKIEEKFINCDHFQKANEIYPIDWNIGNRMIYLDGYRRKYLKTNGRTHVFFTDGSCNPNNKSPESVGGYGAVFVEGKYKDTVIYGNLDTSEYNASNQRAEGQAIISGLEYIIRDWDWEKVIIVTDSNFWKNLLTIWMKNWTEDMFEEKSNPDLTKKSWKLWNTILSKRKKIDIIHIHGHNKKWLAYPEYTWKHYAASTNNYVDEIANYARKHLNRGEEKIFLEF